MDASKNIKVTKPELISTFSVIETKITELHKCSAKDFSQLNDGLKAYHRKTAIISDNASRIFTMLSGDESNQFLRKLEDIQIQIKDCQIRIEQKNSENILMLEKILAKSILLTVSLKNFRQDLTTFNFLATNYKLLANYENFDTEWNAAVTVWEKLIRKIRSSLPVITDGLELFKNQLYSCIENSKFNQESSSFKFRHLVKEVEACIKLVSHKIQESDLHLPVIKHKIENSSKSIENIITHLQYQDIIKQKIDHIKNSHIQILNELQDPDFNDENEDEIVPSGKFYKIGDIAGLQISQLMLVNKEYQLAIEVITRNFQQIGYDLSAISSISQQFSSDDNKSEITLIQQVKDKLGQGVIVLDLNNFNELSSNLQEIINEHDDILKEAKRIRFPLEKIINLDLFEHNEKAKEPFSDDNQSQLLKQIASLVNEINLMAGNVFENLNEIFELSDQVSSEEAGDEWRTQLEQDHIKLMVDISKILDSLDKEDHSLDSLLRQNQQLSEEIQTNIKSTINRVDYYDFFEKVIEEVVQNLNSVNLKLKPIGGNGQKSEKIKNLENLKEIYTMESERIIHERAENGEEGKYDDITQAVNEEDDDSLELF